MPSFCFRPYVYDNVSYYFVYFPLSFANDPVGDPTPQMMKDPS